jgi:hypothetical protein
MIFQMQTRRARSLRPVLVSLEERAMLNATLPTVNHLAVVSQQSVQLAKVVPPVVTLVGTAVNKGFTFVNFDGPNGGTAAGQGTNINGISNTGIGVGFTIGATGNFTNFTASTLPKGGKVLTSLTSPAANAFGINAFGVVVGTDGNGNAFFESNGVVKTFIPFGGTSAVAFGINDYDQIVGQYTTAAGTSPGFVRLNAKTYLTINAPSGPNIVFAQSISSTGQIVGYYVGNDGQDHGFVANIRSARNGVITATPVGDPHIPAVAGEPGATFVFSQILSVNDHGIAVGYYGDSTTSQHGFFYNTKTGVYTFLDDPRAAFNAGVEVTQITGITNSGEIAGFYSDANGVFHGFAALPPRF